MTSFLPESKKWDLTKKIMDSILIFVNMVLLDMQDLGLVLNVA